MSHRITIVALVIAVLVILLLWPGDEPGREDDPPEATLDASAGADATPTRGTQPGTAWPEPAAMTDESAAAERQVPAPACTLDQLEYALYGGESLQDVLIRRGETLSPLLAASNDAELIVASARMDPAISLAAQSERLERAVALAPKHPLVLWHAALHCLEHDSVAFCRDPQFRANVDAVLGSNGAYWAVAASVSTFRGDRDGALEALVRAASAPEFDVYQGEHLLMYERALAAGGDMPYRQRIHEARAFSARHADYWTIVQVCVRQSATDDNWLSACGELASRLAGDGRTIMAKRMGIELQSVLSRNGDGSQAFALEESSLDDDARRLFERNPEHLALAEQWMLADDTFAANLVDGIIANGEAYAYLRAVDEAERRAADASSNPCDFAGAARP